jgi:hypothetical protein
VSSGVNPTTVVPTDEHFKTFDMKVPKPTKEEAVENRLKRTRFAMDRRKI